MPATPMKHDLYLYPVKRMASMPSNAACGTGKVRLETVLTAVYWSTQSRCRTGDTVRTLVAISSIPPTCPTNHFIKVRLSMEFHPYNMRPFLHYI